MASHFKLTYHRRLFLELVAYSLLMFVGFALFQYHREKEFKIAELNGKLQTVNSQIISVLSQWQSDWRSALPAVVRSEGMRVSIIDSAGRVVYDNSLDTLPAASHLSREEIAEALATGEGFAVRRHSESTGNTYFYSAKRGNGYVVRTALPYSVSLSNFLSADRAFLWAMAGVTLLMCLLGYFATRRLGRHVERLNAFAERAERGERIEDDDTFPSDELGEISSHIVRLYSKLQRTAAERDRQHRLAMHEEQEKIRIKRQLTNNINHELKTPVAAMSVCLETLVAHEDMEPERRRDFIRRCYGANRRLSRLLADVASITRLEDGAANIRRAPADISAIATEAVSDFEALAEDRGMTVANHLPGNLTIDCNGALIASVFHNLLSNAIAYSGGSLIEIRLVSRYRGWLTVSVADNGSGVPEEHLPHLFERFYRVDKGRSRKAGGTGLGLAIVKNAIAWHGGSVTVANRRTGGLIITFTLPEAPAKKDSVTEM